MSKLIRIGMPVDGQTRRFSRLTKNRFLYSCPRCVGLVSNYQDYCVCDFDLRIVSNLYSSKTR